jgi:hypothetical protein
MATPNPTWPPSTGLNTIIVPTKDAILTTSAHTRILAPAALVFSILRDAAGYPSWNSFCPSVTIHAQPADMPPASQTLARGTSFTFHVVMDAARPGKVTPTQLRVTDVSTPGAPSAYVSPEVAGRDGTFTRDLQRVYRIAWTTEGAYVSMGLRSERFHEVIVVGERECEVRTWECQGNFLARTVKWLFEAKLKVKFEDWCKDLKKISEEKAQELGQTGE